MVRVLPAAPVLDASGPSPAIAGTAQQGVTLSVSSGNWDNDPTQFGYVLEDCDGTGTVCVPISGAASANSYTVQSTDVGSTIEVVVTASNAGGGNQATTGPDGPCCRRRRWRTVRGRRRSAGLRIRATR